MADSRTPARLHHHYLVEKELAGRLRNSSREERRELFGKLYGELFDRVPDHPRLVRRDTPQLSRRSIESRLNLLRPFLFPEATFLEFAPGDCRLAEEVCKSVGKVIAADISDQRGTESVPSNFELVIYDGYTLNQPSESADIIFSYQFIEHLHPADVDLHFALAHRLLRPGGVYIFATPHRFSGPHDVSRHFSDTPEGFHLKEWTYEEVFKVLSDAGFASACTYRCGKPRNYQVATALTLGTEQVLGWVRNRKWQRWLSRGIFESVTVAAFK